jgi:hypothetical protein
MRFRIVSVVLAGLWFASPAPAASSAAIPFASTGAEGPFHPVSDVLLPAGVHNFTTINIPPGVHVTFSGSGYVRLLATGSFYVGGTLNASALNNGGGGALSLFGPADITIDGAILANGTNGGGAGAVLIGTPGTLTLSNATVTAVPAADDSAPPSSAIGAVFFIASALTNSGGMMNPPLYPMANQRVASYGTLDTIGTTNAADITVYPGMGTNSYSPPLGPGAGGRVYVTDDPPPTPVPFVLQSRLLADGTFQLNFSNTPGTTFTVSIATNLELSFSDWTQTLVVTESAPGQFQFNDPRATNGENRYYRVHSP